MFSKLFSFLRPAPRRVAIAPALWRQTVDALPFLAHLAADEEQRLRDLCEQFLASKEFSGAGGIELTDAMCVAIAVQGCLPVLNLGLSPYRGWVGIVVYPDEFVVPRQIEDESGVVHEFDDVVAGEAWDGGPLLVSWQDAQMAGDGYNVLIHEFAHKLDLTNGEADGLPALHSGLQAADWCAVLDAAYADFCRQLDAADAAAENAASEEAAESCYADLPLDPYAAENPGEFFAVASETFFEQPQRLREAYPALYEQFCRYYRQTPHVRLAV